ncbi:protein NDR1-like [Papaver somniferum]|uniref:protein NDR1-like n=1 Tax=Papaver somniferum TaxID=3469 RepID=UPI000E6FF42B|nr:protein NDR1-like [Papaver somniferum]
MSKRMKLPPLGCIILTAIVGVFFLYDFFRVPYDPKSPICSVDKFYVPVLDKSLYSDENADAATVDTTISFDLKLENGNSRRTGVKYGILNISLYYIQKRDDIGRDQQITIGNVSIRGFHQKGTKAVHRLETVQTFGVPWKEAKMAVTNGSNTMFMVDLASIVRLEIPYFDSDGYSTKTIIERRILNLGVNVSVNDQGMKTLPGSLRLISISASSPYQSHVAF